MAIFAFGEIFLLMVVAIVFSNLFKGGEESVAFNVLILILSILFWNGVGLYCLSNTASALILRDDTVTVRWSKNRLTTYPWQNIKIRNVGSTSAQIILVNDDNWKCAKLTFPGVTVLDGFSGKYKELITRMREKTEGTNSPFRTNLE